MEKLLNIDFVQGVPHSDKIKEIFDGYHHILCLDDLEHEVSNSKEAKSLFTQLFDHNNLSVIYLNRNLYYKGKCAKILNLNTAYTVLMRNPRNAQQMALIDCQLGIGKTLEKAYKNATNKPFGYLIVDLSPKGDETYRLRSNVFPNEAPVIVYQ